ncbi:hypothetical protein CBS63078_8689 [Aspergillus niger]|nr:hypothetical protein CBS115989_753 [Aspergillus niger]KAI2827660.1 hypothetical protein CBS133816_6262 [Aspergillus niger]KAI2837325.1 hypothetical protein CBS11350_8817 [Aspergillus niger]KAI2862220.1 hypothetical protein CBS11232_441 [Aspergillus niger]KAI2882156.1 hypothetical protein CBS115988_83 [Aspergillus niger]
MKTPPRLFGIQFRSFSKSRKVLQIRVTHVPLAVPSIYPSSSHQPIQSPLLLLLVAQPRLDSLAIRALRLLYCPIVGRLLFHLGIPDNLHLTINLLRHLASHLSNLPSSSPF